MVTRKSRIRLTGAIEQLARGPAIKTDDGETWIIELSDGLELPANGMVVLEGVQAGLDRLLVDWIGVHQSI
jgi:Protein of unknown function (DUF5818)